MPVLSIRLADDPVLRKKAKRVTKIDDSVQRLTDNMFETMYFATGVGLAAPQVGVSLRVIVIDDREHEPTALVNPQVVKRVGEREVEEGCLSIPGYKGLVKRSVSVTVKGLNRHGQEVRIKATELLSQALEHEIDHLNGILYTDRLVSPDKMWKVEPKPVAAEEKEEEMAAAEAGL